MTDSPDSEAASFSLVHGGAIYRISRRFRLTREGLLGLSIRCAVSFGLTFVPLAVLAAAQGVLYGHRVILPLLSDITIYARFVFALPFLVVAEPIVDRRLADAIRMFHTTGVLEGSAQADFDRAMRRLEQVRDSFLPEILLLLGAFTFSWVSSRAILELPVSSWRELVPHSALSLTMAGRWFELVSLPIFQFLALRWLWRILLWAVFLIRVSRSELKLVATHPDGAAGLAFLGEAHTVFVFVLIPIAATAAAKGVQFIQFSGSTIMSLQPALGSFAAFGLLLALGPLLVFTPKLVHTKRAGLYRYGTLASDYTRQFDRKWLQGGSGDEEILGTADIQSLADLGNSFAFVEKMRVVPANLRHAITVLLASVLPVVPFLALVVPVKEILNQLLSLVAR